MAKANQYDASCCFVGEVEDYGLLPSNATYDVLPPKPWVRMWPQYTAGTGWELVIDHRERKSPYFTTDVEQEGTPYWLPTPFGEDNWQSQPRMMKEVGPLPEGAVQERPEKPLAVAQNEKRREIDAGYESALVAALTMPHATPTPMTVAMETSALLAVDPDGVDSIRAVLDARRAELRAQVESTSTMDSVESIAVSYPI